MTTVRERQVADYLDMLRRKAMLADSRYAGYKLEDRTGRGLGVQEQGGAYQVVEYIDRVRKDGTPLTQIATLKSHFRTEREARLWVAGLKDWLANR